ncbi:hypothetical protein VOI54_06680 [Tamlana sp. 2201CG12-4]|uniref:hypothetical protein n=1 Tax=Tamlana sp. 2201CG12-4 TaxID=3112582 RepID=UPI002DBBC460|nr:hypothetical protein [Tamlana sp. 2201CG12-4]MEC3906697.1 hypothetical protein [Tamlana sp. 2201CG12-4]
MKQRCVFILVLMLVSCEYFNVKKTSSEAILNEELQTFNWNDVDEYPSFSLCDSLNTKAERISCFQSTIVNHITSHLEKEVIIVTQDINDTIVLQLQVSKEGDLVLMNTKIDSLTIQEIPNIKTLLIKSLDTLPKIFPANKKGQLVTTNFSLPIIINVN